MILSGVDLNVKSMTYSLLHRDAKDFHELGQTRFFTVDRVAAKDNLLTVCGLLRRQPRCQRFPVF
jgi:hypothetical protein